MRRVTTNGRLKKPFLLIAASKAIMQLEGNRQPLGSSPSSRACSWTRCVPRHTHRMRWLSRPKLHQRSNQRLCRSPQKVAWRHMAHSPRQNIPPCQEHCMEPQGQSSELGDAVASLEHTYGSCSSTRRQLFGSKAVAAFAAASVVGSAMLAPLPGLAEDVSLQITGIQAEQQVSNYKVHAGNVTHRNCGCCPCHTLTVSLHGRKSVAVS